MAPDPPALTPRTHFMKHLRHPADRARCPLWVVLALGMSATNPGTAADAPTAAPSTPRTGAGRAIELKARLVEANADTLRRPDLAPPTTKSGPIPPGVAEAWLERLKAGPGVDLLAAPTLLTLSGQPARMSLGVDATGSSVSRRGAPPPPTSSRLDLTASSDLRDPTLLELTAAGEVVDRADVPSGQRSRVAFRTNAVQGSARLKEGQTLILPFPAITNRVVMIDRVVGLSNIPLLGRLFTRRSTGVEVRQRLLLVTPRWADLAAPSPSPSPVKGP